MMNMMVDACMKEAILGEQAGVQVEWKGKVPGEYTEGRKGKVPGRCTEGRGFLTHLIALLRGCASGD